MFKSRVIIFPLLIISFFVFVTIHLACSDSSTCDSSNCRAGCCYNGSCLDLKQQLQSKNKLCGKGGAQCSSCLEGYQCQNGECVLDTSNQCSNCTGCCRDGECIELEDQTKESGLCGKLGMACVSCDQSGMQCINGECRSCVPDCTGKCPGADDGCDGKCDASNSICPGCCTEDNHCLAGDESTACGIEGEPCKDCTAESKTCDAASQTCIGNCVPQCDGKCKGADDGCKGTCPENKCTGCCDGTVCKPGTAVDACGKSSVNNGACAKCDSTKQICENNQCVAKPPICTNCEGCCSADGKCVPYYLSITQTQCGKGGQPCKTCSGNTPNCHCGECKAEACTGCCSGIYFTCEAGDTWEFCGKNGTFCNQCDDGMGMPGYCSDGECF